MRGPGQDVNVPAVAQGIPVRLASDGTLKTIVFSVDYDPRLISITGATPATGLPGGASVRFTTEVISATQVRARITIVTDTPVPAGTVTLVNLGAYVPATAPYASREVLALSVQSINGDTQAAATTGGGLHVVGYLGDIDGDARLTTADVTRLTRLVSGFSTSATTFSAWPDLSPLLVSDINGDARINATDLNFLGAEVRGSNRPEIPDVPAGIAPRLGAAFVSRPDPTLPAPFVPQPEARLAPATVDWSGTYANFDLTPARPGAAKAPSWFDAPWVRDLAARLGEPNADGTPASERTAAGVLRKLSRGLSRGAR
jgi:hypothetical protein